MKNKMYHVILPMKSHPNVKYDGKIPKILAGILWVIILSCIVFALTSF